jgi:hypothetical protein
MKAYLIDPVQRDITLVDVAEEETLQDMYDKLSYTDHEVDKVEAVGLNFNHCIYVDEEGLFKPNRDFFNFRITNTNTVRLVGRGLVMAHNREGDMIDVGISLRELYSRVFSYQPVEDAV